MINLPHRSEIKNNYRPEVSESNPESELYYHLLKGGLRGQRQYPIGKYFADISFPDYKLIIEYDGKIHLDNLEYDAKRAKEIMDMGWNILRIANKINRFEITLNDKDFYCNKVSNNIFELAIYSVKKYIREIIKRDKKFIEKFASEEIKIDESGDISFNSNEYYGMKSVQWSIKKKMGWDN